MEGRPFAPPPRQEVDGVIGMKFSSTICTLVLAALSAYSWGGTVRYEVTTQNEVGIQARLESVVGHDGSVERLAQGQYQVTYSGSKPYHTTLKLRRSPGVVSAEPIEPANPMDSRKDQSLSAIRSRIVGYRENYLAYYKAVHGPTAKPAKVPGAGFIESYLHFYEERAFPYDKIDWDKYSLAEVVRDALPAADLYGAPGLEMPQFTGNWEFVGPKNLTIPYQIYYGTPPLGGRLNGVAWHPTDSNTIYIAGAQSGVWKTTDGGTNWTSMSDGWTNLRTSAISIDPSNPQTVYVGTGDWQGGLGSGYGIRKTTDGGATWTTIGASQFSGTAVKDIAIDPDNPSTLIVASSYSSNTKQLYRSTNGGTTWTAVGPNQRWAGLSWGALSGGVRPLYAISDFGSLQLSLDRGLTWSAIATPLALSYVDVAASRVDTNVVYFINSNSSEIYKSTNRGASWTSLKTAFNTASTSYNWSQASYDMHIHCSSNGANDVVYVGLIDLVQSPNGGTTWQSVGRSYQNNSLLHNDQHSFAVNPQNPNQALVGCDGGIFRFNYVPSSNTWSFTPLNANLGGTTQFYHAAYHPTDARRMIGGTQDNASPATLGDLNNWANPGAGDGCFQGISQQNPNVQYTTWQYLGMERTTNNWLTSSNISPTTSGENVPFIGVIEVDPNNGDLCYAGTNYLHRYNNATGSWSYQLGGTAVAGSGTVRSIAVAKGDSNRIYTGASNGTVMMSTNSGSTWTTISSGSPSLPAGYTIKDISVNPNNSSDILVVLSGTGTPHVWQCTNTQAATRVWVNRSGTLPDVSHNSITRDPAQPSTRFFVGTDVGVFFSNDGGGSWSNATAPLGLPNVRVDDLTAVSGTNFLYAATHGRGIWRINMTQLTLTGISFAPNPVYAVNDVTITVNLSGPAPTGGLIVNLTSSNGVLLPVPPTLNFPAGATSASVVVTTTYTTTDIPVTVQATLNTSSQIGTVLIQFLLGDINHDGEVGPADYTRFVLAFGSMVGDPNWDADCDLNNDGEVGPADFTILSQQFGLP